MLPESHSRTLVTFLFIVALMAVLVFGCTPAMKSSKPPSNTAMFYKALDEDQKALYRANLYYHYLAGQVALTKQDARSTVEHFNLAVEMDDDSLELQLIGATLNLRLGNIEAAIKHAERAFEIDPDNLEAAVLLGGLYTAQGKTDLAIERYEKALKLHPESEKLALFLAGAYLDKKDVQKAEKQLKKMLRNHPGSPVGNYELGRIYLLREDYDKALKHLNDSIQNAPTFSKPYLAVGYVREAKGDKKGAVEMFRKVLELTPENNELRNHVIALLLALDDPKGAIEENERLKFFQQDSTNVHYNRAMILMQQEQYGEAISEFEIVLGREPGNSSARYFLGSAHTRLRDYGKAMEELAKIDPQDRLYPSAVEARAHLLRKMGKLTQALQIVNEALASHPKDVGLHRVLGLTYSTLGRHDKAEEAIKAGIVLAPENKEMIYTLANVYEKAGKYRKGIRLMEEELEKNPDNVDALNYIGYTLADYGEDLDKALAMTQKALELRPNDGYITDSVGWVLYRLGRVEEAVEMLEKAVEIVQDEPVILEHLGDVYLDAERKDEALRTYIRARESNPEPDQVDRLLKKIKELGG